MIIAIDGPAASGKGVLSKMLGQHYSIPHLDTGLIYRSLAYHLLSANIPLNDKEQAIKIAETITFNHLNINLLSSQEVAEAASYIACIKEVRNILSIKQRDFANQPEGAILEGRDIATVICPNADVKLFITATQNVRAARRLQDIESKGEKTTFTKVLEDIKRRDERDTTRTECPLQQHKDAHLLDTTEMSIQCAFQAIKKIVDPVYIYKKGSIKKEM